MDDLQREGTSWSSSLSHRLPTVSAAQALQKSAANRAISTSLERLDEALSHEVVPSGQALGSKGISRSHVTEVFGPPGAGKTTLALTVAANALKDGGRVTWIDTGPPLVGKRFKQMLSQSAFISTKDDAPSPSKTPDQLLESFLYLRASTIPHLLSLLLHPPPKFLPNDTTLLVIDSMTMLFTSAYPPTASAATTATKKTPTSINTNDIPLETWKDKRSPRLSTRKWTVAEDIITRLAGLAASRNMAVLLTSHATTTTTTTTPQGPKKLSLRPAMSGSVWDPFVHFRIALYKSWLPVEEEEEEEEATPDLPKSARLWVTSFAEVLKAKGNSSTDIEPVPFIIEDSGPKSLRKSPRATKYIGQGGGSLLPSHRKRKIGMITGSEEEEEQEQGDDDGDEYGWSENDDALIDTLTRPFDEEQEQEREQEQDFTLILGL